MYFIHQLKLQAIIQHSFCANVVFVIQAKLHYLLYGTRLPWVNERSIMLSTYSIFSELIETLLPQFRRHFQIHFNGNYGFRLRFHWSLFLRFELTIFQHWLRSWLDADQATIHYLNKWCIYALLGLNELISMLLGRRRLCKYVLTYATIVPRTCNIWKAQWKHSYLTFWLAGYRLGTKTQTRIVTLMQLLHVLL